MKDLVNLQKQERCNALARHMMKTAHTTDNVHGK